MTQPKQYDFLKLNTGDEFTEVARRYLVYINAAISMRDEIGSDMATSLGQLHDFFVKDGKLIVAKEVRQLAVACCALEMAELLVK